MATKKTWSESINEALPLKLPKKDFKSFQDLPPLTALEQPLPPIDIPPVEAMAINKNAAKTLDTLAWATGSLAGGVMKGGDDAAMDLKDVALNVGVNKPVEKKQGDAAPAPQPVQQQDEREPQFVSKRDLQTKIRLQKLLKQGMTPNEAMQRINDTTFAGEANAPATKDQIKEAVAIGAINRNQAETIASDNKALSRTGLRQSGSMSGMTPEVEWRDMTKFQNSVGALDVIGRPIPGGDSSLTNGNVYEERMGDGRFVQQSLPGDIALAKHFGEGWLTATPQQRQAMLRAEDKSLFQTPDSTAFTDPTAQYGVAPDGARTVSGIYGGGYAKLPSIPPASAQAPQPNLPELPDYLKKDKDVQDMLRNIQA